VLKRTRGSIDGAIGGAVAAVLLVVTALIVIACSPASGPTSAGSEPVASTAASTVEASPVPSTGFTFTADDVVSYYDTQGYACGEKRPSTQAAGFEVATCQTVDSAGRTRVVGVVTDAAGGLANAWASLTASSTEAALDPADALDPLAGFLGAMLGEQRAESLLGWLADHIGDTYAQTTVGPIAVATYREGEADLSRIYVEVANAAYLQAPSAAP
jgi:hypothetical protein